LTGLAKVTLLSVKAPPASNLKGKTIPFHSPDTILKGSASNTTTPKLFFEL